MARPGPEETRSGVKRQQAFGAGPAHKAAAGPTRVDMDGARGAKVMALRGGPRRRPVGWTGTAASSRSATARRHATMPLAMTGANGGLPKADAPATVRSPWRLASAFPALPFGPAPRRGRPQIGRPRGRPYDGRPGGLRTGSPPSPPPRSIRPTVRRLPRSPRLSGPGPHRAGRHPPIDRPFGAGRRSRPIRRPPAPAPRPRRSRRTPDASPGDASRGGGRSPRCREASGHVRPRSPD